MATAADADLSQLQRRLERTREDLADAVADLRDAAQALATARHWRRAAQRRFERRPGPWMAIAFAAGAWLGRRL